MLSAGSSRFEIELKKRLTQEIEKLTLELALGMAVKDYAQYQNYVGRLTMLNAVVDQYCGEVETKLNQE